MIIPRKVKFAAKKKENENIEFRTFLKCNANDEILDRQFAELHEELFANYDCNRCRNCCKMYYGTIPANDIEKDSEYLGISKEQFITTYLIGKRNEDGYSTKHKPCDFLENDGTCKLGDCKPENCVNYPYTNQPDRWESLYSVLEAVEVCPVAFEIYERLKKEYGFEYRG